ncbi:MAG: IS66 family insertion sequence element accessory protein TnpB [Clostridia bacterium]|nr:IS66 family insertion sequence element accessory protein TnpB [Clostridia bacterium]
MDKITDAKAEFRLRQWTQIIQTCQTSGMTVAGWCRQNNINPKTYYYWLRRIRSKACESREIITHANNQPIVPVAFKQTMVSAAITIHLTSVSVDIHNGASRDTIEAVMAALKNIC